MIYRILVTAATSRLNSAQSFPEVMGELVARLIDCRYEVEEGVRMYNDSGADGTREDTPPVKFIRGTTVSGRVIEAWGPAEGSSYNRLDAEFPGGSSDFALDVLNQLIEAGIESGIVTIRSDYSNELKKLAGVDNEDDRAVTQRECGYRLNEQGKLYLSNDDGVKLAPLRDYLLAQVRKQEELDKAENERVHEYDREEEQSRM